MNFGVSKQQKSKSISLSLSLSVATENVYSLIQHPKDRGRLDPEGTNGRLVGQGVQRTPQLSGRPIQGIPLPGMMGMSPSCFSQRQVPYNTLRHLSCATKRCCFIEKLNVAMVIVLKLVTAAN